MRQRFARPVVRTAMVAMTAMLAAAGCSSDPGGGDPAPGRTPDDGAAAASIRGDRYCEVLGITPSAAGLTAEVYSTFPLNDCPQDQWQALDPATLPAVAGTPLALLNGPRFWSIDAVTRTSTDDIVQREFGGLAMNRYATVTVPGLEAARESYVVREVDRRAVMTLFAGREVYILIDPAGADYAMQSWSHQVDPDLTEGDLATLGDRLELPDGWQFETRTLTEDLVIRFGEEPARVVQDDLGNTYSRITS